jgi:hypothetical protein
VTRKRSFNRRLQRVAPSQPKNLNVGRRRWNAIPERVGKENHEVIKM